MISTDRLSRRLEELERESGKTADVLTIEKRTGVELLRWGNQIIKIIRGASVDDL